jgi:hypothetical protein
LRLNRLVAGLVTAGLALTGPVLISSPAHAVDAASVVSLNTPSRTAFEYGDELYLSGRVTLADGKSVNSPATTSLQVSTPSNPTWTTVATDDSSYFSFSDIKVPSNASYKVVFAGGPAGFGSSAVNALPSESAPVAVTVARKLTVKSKGLKVRGKITPKYTGKVRLLKMVGKKKTKKWMVVKAKKGRFSYRAPNRSGFKYVIVVPGDKDFAAVYQARQVI